MSQIDATTLVKVVALTLNPDFIDIYGAFGARNATYKPPFIGHRGWMLYGDAEPLDGTDLMVCWDHTPYEIDLELYPPAGAGPELTPTWGEFTCTLEIADGTFDADTTIRVDYEVAEE